MTRTTATILGLYCVIVGVCVIALGLLFMAGLGTKEPSRQPSSPQRGGGGGGGRYPAAAKEPSRQPSSPQPPGPIRSGSPEPLPSHSQRMYRGRVHAALQPRGLVAIDVGGLPVLIPVTWEGALPAPGRDTLVEVVEVAHGPWRVQRPDSAGPPAAGTVARIAGGSPGRPY